MLGKAFPFQWGFVQLDHFTEPGGDHKKKEKMGTSKKDVSSGGRGKRSQPPILPASPKRARRNVAFTKAGMHSSSCR